MATPLRVLRHATDEAIRFARAGMSPNEATESVSDHFQLTFEDRVEVESRVRHATEPHRVRAHSGVAIGWVKPGSSGMFLAVHDKFGPGNWSVSPADAHLAVLRADNEAGWPSKVGGK
jgi:hypothetical protein